MRTIVWWAVTALVFTNVAAADFGTKGGPEPANVDEIVNVLRQDPYDMELLISYNVVITTSARMSRLPNARVDWRGRSQRFGAFIASAALPMIIPTRAVHQLR